MNVALTGDRVTSRFDNWSID